MLAGSYNWWAELDRSDAGETRVCPTMLEVYKRVESSENGMKFLFSVFLRVSMDAARSI